DALVNFRMLLNAVELSDNKLYICIDEYDGSMNEALKNKTLYHHKDKGDIKIELIESSFNQFFSILKTACDENIACVFLTGVTPVVMAEFTSGFNISVDLTLDEEFWDLYGFKKSEIKILLDKAFGYNLSDNIKEQIMSWLKEENDG
ncbi:14411_t:CDS:2, partial [Funneliformis caledonium]